MSRTTDILNVINKICFSLIIIFLAWKTGSRIAAMFLLIIYVSSQIGNVQEYKKKDRIR